MKRLIFFFLILLGSIWLGITIYQQPGYVLVTYQHWAIETTTWFLILFLLLMFFLFHLIVNLLRGIITLPHRLENWWQTRKQNKAIKSLKKGFIASLQDNWKKSEKAFLKTSGNDKLSFISYVMAAQIADEQNNEEKRNRYLNYAKKEDNKNAYLAEALQVQYSLKHQKPEHALHLLLPLRAEHPKDKFLLRLHAETYIQLEDWHHLRVLLPELKKQHVYNDSHYKQLEKDVYLHCLKDHFYGNFEELQITWNRVPRYLRHDPDIVVAYTVHLNRWNQSEQAEALIRKELKKQFDHRLMRYYVMTRSKVPTKQLALSEKLLKENDEDAASLRAMGILCLKNKLWGQAKDYLERSLKLQPMTEVYSALGYVYENLGENEKALIYYRKGLRALMSPV